jgi:hypothetical protein
LRERRSEARRDRQVDAPPVPRRDRRLLFGANVTIFTAACGESAQLHGELAGLNCPGTDAPASAQKPRFEMTYLLYPLVIVAAIFVAVASAASFSL